jgi:forkhead box protein N
MDAIFYQQKQDVMDIFSLDMTNFDDVDSVGSQSTIKKKRISDGMDSYWKTCPRDNSSVAELRFHQDLSKDVNGMEYESSESQFMLEGFLTGDVYLMNDLVDPLLGEAQDDSIHWMKSREETVKIEKADVVIKQEPFILPDEKEYLANDTIKKENKSPSYCSDNSLLSHVRDYRTLDIRTEKHPLLEEDSNDSYSVKEDIAAYHASSTLDEIQSNHGAPHQRFSSDDDYQNIKSKREGNQMRIKRKTKKAEWTKPSYSYTCLITLAIKNSHAGALPVKQIYKFICEHFPFYQSAPIRWKNCVRHNLCQSNFFEKKPREQGGWVWTISPCKLYNVNLELNRFKNRNLKGIKKAMKHPHLLESLEEGTVRFDAESADENPQPDYFSDTQSLHSSTELSHSPPHLSPPHLSPPHDIQHNQDSKKILREFIGRKYPKEKHYNVLPSPQYITENNNVQKSPLNFQETQEVPVSEIDHVQSSSPQYKEDEEDNLSMGEVKLEDLSFSEEQLLSAIKFENFDFNAADLEELENEDSNSNQSPYQAEQAHNEHSSYVSHIGKFNTNIKVSNAELQIEGLIDELSLDADRFASKSTNSTQTQPSAVITTKPQVILKINNQSPVYSHQNTQQYSFMNQQINANNQVDPTNNFQYILQKPVPESGPPMRILTHQNVNKTSFSKPPYSYSCLIGLALKNSLNEGLLVSDIYAFMIKHFPYFSDDIAPSGWKNSVRHNLSTGKWFEKKHTAQGLNNKRSVLWAIVPEKKDYVDDALKKFRGRELSEIKDSMRFPEQLEALEEGRRKTVTPHNYKSYKIRPSSEDYHWDQHIMDTPVAQSTMTRNHQVVHTISSGPHATQFPRFSSLSNPNDKVTYVTQIKSENSHSY